MNKHISQLLVVVAIILVIRPVKSMAAETMFFDSTDHYLGACQLTDKSEWELKEDVAVSKFEVWYNWGKNETELPVKLYKDGAVFAEFTATRSSCDPYQQQWCNADFMINKVFPKGKYSTKIPNSRQCLKPGGTGAIRLYKDDGVVPTVVTTVTAEPTPTVIPTVTTSPPQPREITAQQPNITTCGCSNTKTIASAAITSAGVSLGLWWLLRKK